MKLRKIGVAALASGLAIAGLGAMAEGTAGAAKVSLDGHIACASSGSTAIKPGILLTSNLLPKGKDKKIKYTTTGTGSGCTGSVTGGSLPSGFTTSSKSKGLSRVLVQPASACTSTLRTSKTKITFNTGAKVKVTLISDLNNYAFNTTTQVSTPFPPCGSPAGVATQFAVDHANDRIEARSHGLSGGKAFKGKNVVSKSVTTETLIAELADANDATGVGVTLLHGDPAFTTLTIG
jgi:hypothetical protein